MPGNLSEALSNIYIPFLNIFQGQEIFIKLYKIFIALCKSSQTFGNIYEAL